MQGRIMKLTEKEKKAYQEMAKKALEEHPDLADKYSAIGRKYLATMEVVKKAEEKR